MYLLHHAGGSARQLRTSSARLLQHKFIGVYPQGALYSDGRGGQRAGWNTGLQLPSTSSNTSLHDDIAFLRAITAKFRAVGHRGRLYAIGTSNGAALAHRIGADGTNGFSGIVAIATQLTVSPASFGGYPNHPSSTTRPLGVLMVHGSGVRARAWLRIPQHASSCERLLTLCGFRAHSNRASHMPQDTTIPIDGHPNLWGRHVRLASASESIGLWAAVAGCSSSLSTSDANAEYTRGDGQPPVPTTVRFNTFACPATTPVQLVVAACAGHALTTELTIRGRPLLHMALEFLDRVDRACAADPSGICASPTVYAPMLPSPRFSTAHVPPTCVDVPPSRCGCYSPPLGLVAPTKMSPTAPRCCDEAFSSAVEQHGCSVSQLLATTQLNGTRDFRVTSTRCGRTEAQASDPWANLRDDRADDCAQLGSFFEVELVPTLLLAARLGRRLTFASAGWSFGRGYSDDPCSQIPALHRLFQLNGGATEVSTLRKADVLDVSWGGSRRSSMDWGCLVRSRLPFTSIVPPPARVAARGRRLMRRNASITLRQVAPRVKCAFRPDGRPRLTAGFSCDGNNFDRPLDVLATLSTATIFLWRQRMAPSTSDAVASLVRSTLGKLAALISTGVPNEAGHGAAADARRAAVAQRLLYPRSRAALPFAAVHIQEAAVRRAPSAAARRLDAARGIFPLSWWVQQISRIALTDSGLLPVYVVSSGSCATGRRIVTQLAALDPPVVATSSCAEAADEEGGRTMRTGSALAKSLVQREAACSRTATQLAETELIARADRVGIVHHAAGAVLGSLSRLAIRLRPSFIGDDGRDASPTSVAAVLRSVYHLGTSANSDGAHAHADEVGEDTSTPPQTSFGSRGKSVDPSSSISRAPKSIFELCELRLNPQSAADGMERRAEDIEKCPLEDILGMKEGGGREVSGTKALRRVAIRKRRALPPPPPATIARLMPPIPPPPDPPPPPAPCSNSPPPPRSMPRSSSPQHLDPRGSSTSTSIRANVGGTLTRLSLGAYAHVFARLGYDDLNRLKGMNEKELRAVATAVGMKPGHTHRFVDDLLGGIARHRATQRAANAAFPLAYLG